MYKLFCLILLTFFIVWAIYISGSSSLADKDCWENNIQCSTQDTISQRENDTQSQKNSTMYEEKKEKIYELEQSSELEMEQKIRYNQMLREEGKVIVEQYEAQRQKNIQN